MLTDTGCRVSKLRGTAGAVAKVVLEVRVPIRGGALRATPGVAGLAALPL